MKEVWTMSESEVRFSKLSYPLDAVAERRLRIVCQRLDRERIPDFIRDDEPVKLADEYATSTDFFSNAVKMASESVGEDGMPYSRRRANKVALLEQLSFYQKEDVPNRAYDPSYRKAYEHVYSLFSRAGLEPITVNSEEDARSLLTTLDSSTGWDEVEEGVAKKKDFEGQFLRLFTEGMERARAMDLGRPIPLIGKIDAGVNWDEYNDEGDLTFWRKLRGVGPVDTRQTLVARQWAIPLDHLIHSMPQFGPGKDDDWTIREVWKMKCESSFIISKDFSKFDSTQARWLLRDVFRILYSAFKPGTIDPKIWEAMVVAFLDKTYVLLDENDEIVAVECHHGNVSGHPFTTIVNCLVHLLIDETACVHFGLVADRNVTGDDGLTAIKNIDYLDFDIDDYCDYITRFFGIKVNASKTEVYDDPQNQNISYLSREWLPSGAYRDPREIAEKLAFPRYKRPYHGKDVQPCDIVLAAILTYPSAMRQVLRVDDFLADFGYRLDIIRTDRTVLSEMPYNVREYLGYYSNSNRDEESLAFEFECRLLEEDFAESCRIV